MKHVEADYNLSLRYFVALLIVVVPLFSLGTANHGLWSADEPRVAEIGREMAETGNWSVPMLDQKPFLEHPPLYYASLATVFKLAGTATDKVARIPSAAFAFAGVLVLFFLGNLLFGPRVGFISALVLASSAEYFRVAHWVMVDSALTFFVMSALTFFIVGYFSEVRSRKLIFYGLCYLACSVAFLVKGFVAVAIPGVAVLAFLAFSRNLREVVRMHLWLAVLIFIAVTLPWFIELHRQGGSEFFNAFLVQNHLQRFLSIKESVHLGHHHPFYYYLTEFPAGFLPWSIVLAPALVSAFSRLDYADALKRKKLLFAKCWFFAGFVILSLAATKRIVYLLPIFAPIAMMVALYIDNTLSRTNFTKLEKPFLWLFGAVSLAVGLAAVPALFYSVKLFDLHPATSTTALTLCASFLCVCLSGAGLVFLWRHNGKRFWAYTGASTFVLALFSLVVVMPLVDHHKSFVPFCKQISALVPAEKPLYGYQADETLRGAVPFYTGRYMNEIDDISRMEDIIKKERPVYILTRDSHNKFEKELLTIGHVSILRREDMGTDRSLLLLSNQ